MKKKILFTAMSSVMAIGMLTACGANDNNMNNDGDVDYTPVRYNRDNNMDGNRENNNGVFDNDTMDNNRGLLNNNRDRNTGVLNRDRNVEPVEFDDNELDRNSIRGMTENSDGRGMDNNRGSRGLMNNDDQGMNDNNRNGLGGKNGNMSGNR